MRYEAGRAGGGLVSPAPACLGRLGHGGTPVPEVLAQAGAGGRGAGCAAACPLMPSAWVQAGRRLAI